MSSHNDFVLETINFFLDSNLTNIYKKVVIKTYLAKYLTNENKENIINILKNKNNEIYEYIFLNLKEKKKNYYEKTKDEKKKYYQEHKEEISQRNKEKYNKKKEEINKIKEENEKLKKMLNSE